MLFFIIIITLLKFTLSFEPRCSSPPCSLCKYFIPNVKAFDDLGLCRMFKEVSTHKGKQYTLPNYAVHCRENENLCGKAGHLFEPKKTDETKKIGEIEKTDEPKETDETKKTEKTEKIDETEETDETEELEREIFDMLQKIKRHNKKKIYNTTKDLYKLFKRDKKL